MLTFLAVVGCLIYGPLAFIRGLRIDRYKRQLNAIEDAVYCNARQNYADPHGFSQTLKLILKGLY